MRIWGWVKETIGVGSTARSMSRGSGGTGRIEYDLEALVAEADEVASTPRPELSVIRGERERAWLEDRVAELVAAGSIDEFVVDALDADIHWRHVMRCEEIRTRARAVDVETANLKSRADGLVLQIGLHVQGLRGEMSWLSQQLRFAEKELVGEVRDSEGIERRPAVPLVPLGAITQSGPTVSGDLPESRTPRPLHLTTVDTDGVVGDATTRLTPGLDTDKRV